MKNLQNLIILFWVIGGILITFFIGKLLHFKPMNIVFNNPAGESIKSLIVVIIGTTITIPWIRFKIVTPKVSGSLGIEQIWSYAPLIITIIVYLVLTHQSFGSVGLSTLNMKKIVFLIIIMGAYTILPIGLSQGSLKFSKILTLRSLDILCAALIVGFTEEMLFRGLIQVRFMNWLGRYQGWVIASLIMSYWHMPFRIILQGDSVVHSFISCSIGSTPSFLWGYLILQSGNLLPPIVVHTLCNWISTLR